VLQVEDIIKSKHIVIKTNNQFFAIANVFYSYILTLHKKVSLVSDEKIESYLSFLPWYNKLRDTTPSSVDLIIDTQFSVIECFEFLKSNDIKINQKMATSMYCALLIEFDFFKSSKCDGTVFAIASELISLKADYKLCKDHILNRVSLSTFRLKALMLKGMLLTDNARVANVYVSDEDLKATGAVLNDAYLLMREFLSLVNVKEVALKKSDENNKIIKIIKKEI
jgi:phosphoesterase RecJ-like protein